MNAFPETYMIRNKKRLAGDLVALYAQEQVQTVFRSAFVSEAHIEVAHAKTSLPWRRCQLALIGRGAGFSSSKSLEKTLRKHHDIWAEYLRLLGVWVPSRAASEELLDQLLVLLHAALDDEPLAEIVRRHCGPNSDTMWEPTITATHRGTKWTFVLPLPAEMQSELQASPWVPSRSDGVKRFVPVKSIAVAINDEHVERLLSRAPTATLEDVFRLLVQYSALDGGGFHAAVPNPVFDVLAAAPFNITTECFASPLNVWMPNYYSGIPTTDEKFGSGGSFFDATFTSGVYQANPPFTEAFVAAMQEHMEASLAATDKALTFLIIVPAWRQTAAWRALATSKYATGSIVIDSAEHAYCEGKQHLRATRYRLASCDTSIIFLQNAKAAAELTPVPEMFESIAEAFAKPLAATRAAYAARPRGARPSAVVAIDRADAHAPAPLPDISSSNWASFQRNQPKPVPKWKTIAKSKWRSAQANGGAGSSSKSSKSSGKSKSKSKGKSKSKSKSKSKDKSKSKSKSKGKSKDKSKSKSKDKKKRKREGADDGLVGGKRSKRS